jgi:hypothetical protein
MSTEENRHPRVEVSKKDTTRSQKIGTDWAELIARSEIAFSPALNAAAVVESFAQGPFGQGDLAAAISTLNEQIAEIKKGDMSGPEAMLYAQATALQAIFVNLSRLSLSQDLLPQYQTQLTFALKAQAQCRATLEALPVMSQCHCHAGEGPASCPTRCTVTNFPRRHHP